MPKNDDIRLPALIAEMRDEGFAPFPYRKISEGARDGLFPAVLRNGQWYARRADKVRIADALGMKRAAAPARRQTVAA